MIRNIIFDVGNVLAGFNWRQMLEKLFPDSPEIRERVAKATVQCDLWLENDRGVLSEAEIEVLCAERDPGVAEQTKIFFEHRREVVTEYPFTPDWIKGLKARGYMVYLLSNYSENSFEYLKTISVFPSLVDGGVISYQIKKVKPEPEIYQALLDKYSLNPDECVFLDDLPVNIQGAKNAGMHGIVVGDHEQAARELEELLKKDGINK